MCVVPSCQAVFSLSTPRPRGVALHTFVGQGRARDVAAQLLQRLAVVGAAAHGSVQAETLHVGTQLWSERSITGHGALHREHLLPGTRTEGNAVG